MDFLMHQLTFAPPHTDGPIIANLSMQVTESGLYRIAGRNGSGKSTLIELCAGWLEPTSGSVTLNGLPATTRSLHHIRRVCRTQPALYEPMTVRQHIEFASRVRGVDTRTAINMADRLDLATWLEKPAGELSTGLIRKCWLCITTIGYWEIAFIDEPFSGLDSASIQTLLNIFNEWAVDRTVFVVDHTDSITHYNAELKLKNTGLL